MGDILSAAPPLTQPPLRVTFGVRPPRSDCPCCCQAFRGSALIVGSPCSPLAALHVMFDDTRAQ